MRCDLAMQPALSRLFGALLDAWASSPAALARVVELLRRVVENGDAEGSCVGVSQELAELVDSRLSALASTVSEDVDLAIAQIASMVHEGATHGGGGEGAPPADRGAPPVSAVIAPSPRGGEDDALWSQILRITSVAHLGRLVICGWMRKQGEGGFFKRRNWKRRFFELFLLPTGAYLTYSASDDTDACGTISLARVSGVQASEQDVEGSRARVLELETPGRTFLCQPRTVSTKLVPSGTACHVNSFPVAHMRVAAAIDAEKDPTRAADVVDRWAKALDLYLFFQRNSFDCQARLASDPDGMMPKSVILRVTPLSLSLLNGWDPSVILCSWSFFELASLRATHVRGAGPRLELTFHNRVLVLSDLDPIPTMRAIEALVARHLAHDERARR